MTDKAKVRAQAERLQAFFIGAGARGVEADILQPAETLLDLYGEDIRSRAYVTSDPLRGEMMLRPDFTVPVVQSQMAEGTAAGAVTYMGEVFRKQEHEGVRASEFIQVGYETFGDTEEEAAEAKVFALFDEALSPLGLRAATGDIGILMAAVEGLSTTDRRKAALKRHLWRPRRFRALLDRYGGRSPVPESRARLLEAARKKDAAAVAEAAGPAIGLRSRAEVTERIETLLADAEEPPISSNEVAILDHILSLRETSVNALEQLRDVAVDVPQIAPAVTRMDRRLEALAGQGIDVDALDFEASYGRTTMEYYDGFVFGFYAEARPELPPVASGGRYDALTCVLGQGRCLPAVGGVIRPELVLTLTEEAAQ